MSHIDISLLKPGDHFSKTTYYKLVARNADGSFTCQTQHGVDISIGATIVRDCCFSADQFKETKEVTRTELVRIFMEESGDQVFTVEFEKQVKAEDVEKKLTEQKFHEIEQQTKRRKMVEQCLHGETRRMIGYMKNVNDGLGRSTVVDLEQPSGQGVRQVDHRTMVSLILKGTKYVVKK